MAAQRTILVRFDGATAGLRRATRDAEQALSAVNKPVLAVAKGLGALGGAGGAVAVLAGAAGAAAQLAPAALLLPGALLAGGAAMATLKLATSGFADAVSAADPAAFAEATKNMAPAAVATAQALRGMQPRLTELKKSVQGRFFAGFADDVQALGGTYFPVLTTGLSGIAGRMNAMGRSAATALMQPAAVESVNRVLGNTDGLFARMRNTLANVVTGFLKLAGIGSDYLPALGSAVDGVAAKFKAWVDQTGEARIKELIDGALAGFRDLGAIVGNVASAVGSIFTGLGAGGGTALSTLREITAALAAFLASAEAQTALASLGEAMRAAGEATRAVLLSALNMLLPVIAFLAPVVVGLSNFIRDNSDAVVIAAAALGGMVLAVRGIVAAVQLARAVVVAYTAVQWLLNAAMSANPITLVVIAIAALVAALVIAWNTSSEFRGIVLGAWSAVQAGIASAVGVIRGVLGWFGSLPGMFGRWIGDARRAIVDGFNGAVGFVTGLPGRFMGALGNLGGLLSGAGRALVAGFKNGISNAWNGLMGMARDLMGKLRGLWPFSPAKEGPFSGSGYVTHSGRALVGDFAESLRDGQPGILSAARGLMGAAAGPLSGGLSLGGAASAVMGGRAGGSAAAAGPAPTYVTVMIGDQELRNMVRTEIAGANRDTRLDVATTFRRTR